MRHRITPFQLRILLHYFDVRADYIPKTDIAAETIEWWMDLEMIRHTSADIQWDYELTARGKWYIEELLQTPFPVATFYTPDREQD